MTAALRSIVRAFSIGNRLFGSMVGNQRESKKPESIHIIRAHRQLAARILEPLLVATSVEQDPPDVSSSDTNRVTLTGTLGQANASSVRPWHSSQ